MTRYSPTSPQAPPREERDVLQERAGPGQHSGPLQSTIVSENIYQYSYDADPASLQGSQINLRAAPGLYLSQSEIT